MLGYNWRAAIPKTPYKNKGQSYSSTSSESNYLFNKGSIPYSSDKYSNKTETIPNLKTYNSRLLNPSKYRMIKYGRIAAWAQKE